MRLAPLHRLTGLAIALPLLLWMGTGALFHLKHRYGEAYEALAVPTQAPAGWSDARVAPASLPLQGRAVRVHAFVHPDAGPAYLVLAESEAARAFSARDGAPLLAADAMRAREWAEAAVARSAHANRYGTARAGEVPAEMTSRFEGAPLEAWAFEFDGGKTVTVARLTGEVAQTGTLNDFIDLTYRLHYLQWTPWRPVNLALLAVAMPLVVGLALSGVWLWVGRRRAGR